jgi:hypothetical protein
MWLDWNRNETEVLYEPLMLDPSNAQVHKELDGQEADVLYVWYSMSNSTSVEPWICAVKRSIQKK